MQQVLRKAITGKHILSAHDVSDGGLFVTLMEKALPRGLGFDVAMNSKVRPDAFLFGEAQSRAIVSVAIKQKADFERFLSAEKQPFELLGHVGGNTVRIGGNDWGKVERWKRSYNEVLTKIMQ